MTVQNFHPLEDIVLEQLGGVDDIDATLRDVAEYGAGTGWPGFTYYRDTCKFTEENRQSLRQTLRSAADEYGMTVVSFVRGFRCVGDKVPLSAIDAAVNGGFEGIDEDDRTLVENALAWFALEEVAQAYVHACDAAE